MKWWAAGLIGLAALMVAIWHEDCLPPRAVRAAYDGVYEATHRRASHWRCATIERSSGVLEYSSLEPRQCYHFSPPGRMTGIFVQQSEADHFFEGGVQNSRDGLPVSIWISFDQRSDLKRTPRFNPYSGPAAVWHIDFVGRMTRRPSRGGYGHLGMSDADVLVDTMIAARKLTDHQADAARHRISFDSPR